MAEENNIINTPQEQPQATPQVEIDYDKIASLVEGKQKVAEDQVLKGYFKQQGLSADEMASAIEMFKKDKASKVPNVDELKGQISEKDTLIAEANKRWLDAETTLEAYRIAPSLGVDPTTLPYVLKMADTSKVIKEGKVDADALKESINEVLKDLPQLKADPEINNKGFKIGADAENKQGATNAELAKIFGVKG
jgi:hypothetical protein